MELKEYRAEILQDIRLGAVANSNFRRIEFVDHVMRILQESEEVDDYTLCYYDGIIGSRGKRVELDGYDFDDYDGTLTLIVCSFNGTDCPGVRLTKTDIEGMVERAKRFVEGSIDGVAEDSIEESEQAYELARYIRQLSEQEKINRCRILILSDLEKSDRIKTLDVGEIDSIEVLLRVWDISNLFDLEVSRRGFEDIEIDLKDFGVDGIPCLRACSSEGESGYDAYLCAIPGRLLSDLYGKFGSRLMESNVRSFLKLQTKTNKAIRETILKEPEMFFAYNNGITTTATDIRIDETPSGKVIRGFTALQIVNGGQTTASIYTVGKSRDKPDLDPIFVPMKITVISRERAEEVVPQISRSANTQNKVSEADFFSNSKFHKKMEALSRSEMAPQRPGIPYTTRWYYERTRGQYQQDLNSKVGAALSKFKMEYPKSQVFTKTDLSKYRNSYDMKPHVVSKGAQYSLVEFSKSIDESHMDSINSHYFRETVALAILFRRIQDMVSEQPWYNGGYRAQIVTYTMAKLSQMVSDMGGALDLEKIWGMQGIPPELERQLIPIMDLVNTSILMDKREENVAQWCKKPACWECVKGRTLNPLPELNVCLISEARSKWDRKAAARKQKDSDLIHALIDVVNYGSGAWERAMEWGNEHDSLSWEDKDLLKKAINCDKRRPTEREAVAIMKVLERLRREGFSR